MAQTDISALIDFILSNHLGPTFRDLGLLLHKSGPLKLFQIVKQAELKGLTHSEAEIKEGLILLIKHNLVGFWSDEIDERTVYSFNERECLLRLAYPLFL